MHYKIDKHFLKYFQIKISTPKWYMWFCILIFCCLAVGLMFLIKGNYTRKVTLNGSLERSDTISKLYAIDDGYLSKIYVKQGDFVNKYDPIYELDTYLVAPDYEKQQSEDFDTSHPLRPHSSTIKSPITGYIALVSAKEGQQLIKHQFLLSIVQQKEPILYAEFFIPISHSSFLKEGQKLKIKYDSFPLQKLGLQDVVIAKIHPYPIERDKVANFTAPAKDYFGKYLKVHAHLKPQRIDLGNQNIKLQEGDIFEVTVMMENKTLLQWLLGAILSRDTSLNYNKR